MYDPNTQSVIAKFNEFSKSNEQLISKLAKDRIDGIETLIDIQCKIASYFVVDWIYPQMHIRKGRLELMPLLFSLFHRNFFSYFSALKLTISGLYVSARPILRNIFESLMIAKFCHISDDFRVMKRWNSSETIYFSNSILKKIITPDTKPFFDFWSIICEYSHATKSSAQLTIELTKEVDIDGVFENLALLQTLLECSYHLLNTHLITPELSYRAEFYTTRFEPKVRDYNIPELRKESHSLFKKNRKYIGSEAIKLISTYKRKWQIKK